MCANAGKGKEKVIGRNFSSIWDYFHVRNLGMIFRLEPLRSHWGYLSALFKTERMKALMSFQDMYLGLSPEDAPATFSLLQYTEFADGVWYPRGGMSRIVDTMMRAAVGPGSRHRLNLAARCWCGHSVRAGGDARDRA